jgi:hypothetical protein
MRRNKSRISVFPPSYFLLFVVGCMFFLTSCGDSDLGEKFSKDRVVVGAYSQIQIDDLDGLLSKYVTNDRLIRYKDWNSDANDIQTLKDVLNVMAIADTASMNQSEKKAFYINAYNAMTINLILSSYDETLGGTGSLYPGERSIRNIANLDAKVWDFYKWRISGSLVSLNDVENKILRPMGDARIHFAIVCASIGCPPIFNHSFSAQNVDDSLESLAEQFVNSGRSTSFDLTKNQIITSSILNWFAEDFNKTYGSVKNFFRKFFIGINANQVDAITISYSSYNWLLNEAKEVVVKPTTPPGGEVGSGTEDPKCTEPQGSGSENPPECPEPPQGSGFES